MRTAIPDLPAENIIAEPVARNTAPAVGLGAVDAARRAGPDAVIAVFPADPFIGDEPAFDRLVRVALTEARETITTIGVRPTHAETGFGYIRTGARLARAGADPVHDVGGFVEKPDLPTAERYLTSGEHLWNSGMFFLTARRMFEETRRHLPELAALLDAAVAAKDSKAAAAVDRGGYARRPVDLDRQRHHGEGHRAARGAGRLRLERRGELGRASRGAARRRARQRRARRRDADRRRRQHRRRRGGRALRRRRRRARSGRRSPRATRCWSSPRTRPRTYERSSRRPSRPAATICSRNVLL